MFSACECEKYKTSCIWVFWTAAFLFEFQNRRGFFVGFSGGFLFAFFFLTWSCCSMLHLLMCWMWGTSTWLHFKLFLTKIAFLVCKPEQSLIFLFFSLNLLPAKGTSLVSSYAVSLPNKVFSADVCLPWTACAYKLLSYAYKDFLYSWYFLYFFMSPSNSESF